MADNFTASSVAAGDQISAKDLGGGVKAQRALMQHLGAGTTPLDVSNSNPLPVRADLPSGAATDANITAVGGAAGTSPPALAASASGIIGWLRKIVDVLSAGLNATFSGALPAGTNLIGKVGIDQTTPGTTNLVATGFDAIMQAGTVTAKASYTRPADTTQYAINDVLSNSTSAPTAGGLTFAMARASGKGGVITDVVVTSSAPTATTLQGELWLFDQAPTAVNDNAAWALSDADALNVIAVLQFSLIAEASNSWAHLQGLNIGYTAVGSANLRGLVKVKNAYTPISGEVIQFAVKGVQNN